MYNGDKWTLTRARIEDAVAKHNQDMELDHAYRVTLTDESMLVLHTVLLNQEQADFHTNLHTGGRGWKANELFRMFEGIDDYAFGDTKTELGYLDQSLNNVLFAETLDNGSVVYTFDGGVAVCSEVVRFGDMTDDVLRILDVVEIIVG